MPYEVKNTASTNARVVRRQAMVVGPAGRPNLRPHRFFLMVLRIDWYLSTKRHNKHQCTYVYTYAYSCVQKGRGFRPVSNISPYLHISNVLKSCPHYEYVLVRTAYRYLYVRRLYVPNTYGTRIFIQTTIIVLWFIQIMQKLIIFLAMRGFLRVRNFRRLSYVYTYTR